MWKVDIGMDEIPSGYHIAVFNDKKEQISVYGKTVDECTNLAEKVAMALNIYESN